MGPNRHRDGGDTVWDALMGYQQQVVPPLAWAAVVHLMGYQQHVALFAWVVVVVVMVLMGKVERLPSCPSSPRP